jgi:DNA-binding NarL/FixJ family response regulator/signal transduction histidine kinase
LVAALVGWSVVEVVLRQDLAPRPLLLLAALAVLGPLLWRRTHPLVAVAVSFGTLTIVDIVRILTGSQGALLNSISAALILAYALFRWGSGREAASGLGVILLWLPITTVADPTSLAETVAGYAFFLFAAALGAAIRYRAKIRIRDIDQAKAREREQLARELHDTVAHHVSGIAIQAQAGRAIAASHPERAIEALAIIEDAATRTLTELRAIVGVLRASQDTEFAPQPGVAEVEQLATDGQTRPCVEVTLSGEFDDLSPAVGAAIYRLAQESITNARRHARHATQVTVAVTGDADQGTADHRRRRLRRWRPRPSRLRPGGHAGTRLTARRHLPRRPRRRAGLAGRGGPAPNRDATMSIRVLIADDQPIVRTGLTMLLDAQPDIEVVGAAADGREAVRLALQLRPDVGLFDIRMPLMDGIEATRRLAGPDVTDPLPIVVITTFDLDEYVHGALKAGARGFLLKDAGPALLTQAIHAAADGDALIAPSVTVRLLAAFAHAQTSPPRQPIEPLTAREEEVLVPVAQGRTNNEIASELYITPSTVKAHLASLMRKLGARNRVEVAMWAHETGRI